VNQHKTGEDKSDRDYLLVLVDFGGAPITGEIVLENLRHMDAWNLMEDLLHLLILLSIN